MKGFDKLFSNKLQKHANHLICIFLICIIMLVSIKNNILTKNHFLFLHCYMILEENMHVVMNKDII